MIFKARYALEKPAQKVVSFIEQWAEGVSKADIGMVVVDVVQEEKTVSTAEKKPVKKKCRHINDHLSFLESILMYDNVFLISCYYLSVN